MSYFNGPNYYEDKDSKGLFTRYFVYMDKLKDGYYELDKLLRDHGIHKVYNIFYKGEWQLFNHNNGYAIIMVKVRKGVADKFIECLDILKHKMMILEDEEYFKNAKLMMDAVLGNEEYQEYLRMKEEENKNNEE